MGKSLADVTCQGISIEHFFPDHQQQDKVYIKKVNIDAGCAMGIHQHTFTHKSVLARGFGFLTLNGERLGVDAGTVLTVPLGADHLFEAVTNCVWLCIHSTDEQELDKITGDITPEEKPQ